VGFLIAILTLVVAGVVVLVVGAPLRRARRGGESGVGVRHRSRPEDEHAFSPSYSQEELEAAREAKYREIRDTELDYRTGKLSREDYEAIDADLRGEAIEILNRLGPADPPPATDTDEVSAEEVCADRPDA
jgi:hypothetical protein